jgi:hypothetical protein
MIINLSEVKDLFEITVQTDDSILNALLKGNEKKAAQICRRIFEDTVYTEYYDGNGTNILQVKNYPIISVTSIYDDEDRTYGASSLISSADYAIKNLLGQIVLDGLTFSMGMNNIKIAYRAGYSEADMPFDLKIAVAKLVVADYLEIKGGINVVQGQDFFYKPDKLRKDAQLILDRYINYGSDL